MFYLSRICVKIGTFGKNNSASALSARTIAFSLLEAVTTAFLTPTEDEEETSFFTDTLWFTSAELLPEAIVPPGTCGCLRQIDSTAFCYRSEVLQRRITGQFNFAFDLIRIRDL